MLAVRDPTDENRIESPELRYLVIVDGEPYDAAVHGEMIVVEPGGRPGGAERRSDPQ